MFSLNYSTSILNPGLKLIIVLIYLGVISLYFKVVKEYKGAETEIVLKSLFWMSIFGFFGALVRFLGHGTVIGFTEEYSLKWIQSLCYIMQAIFFIYGGKRLLDTSKS